MGAICYTSEKSFSADQAKKLFLSVGWISGRYPQRLYRALMGSSLVVTAWDGERLVGLIRALDDGELTAYVHYALVDPAYQGAASRARRSSWSRTGTGIFSTSRSCLRKAGTPPSTSASASVAWRTASPCR